MSKALLSYYLESCTKDSGSEKSFSSYLLESETRTPSDDVVIAVLESATNSVNALTPVQRNALKPACKFKAIFHHFMVQDLKANRVLPNGQLSAEINPSWWNPAELSSCDRYKYNGDFFQAGFGYSPEHVKPETFLLVVVSEKDPELIEARNVYKIPSCTADCATNDHDITKSVITTLYTYFVPFFDGVVAGKVRPRPSFMEEESSNDSLTC